MRVPLFATLLVAADQLTKLLVMARLRPIGTHRVIPGFFSLSYVENRGAAWGMLAGQQVFLIAFSCLTLAFLVWKRKQLFHGLWGATATLSLIIGGVLGNLIDRIRLSYVVDFLDFYWGEAHFPAFNIADSAICCGVFLFILTQWHHDNRTKKSEG